jgi:hypothetical protein
MRNQIKKEQISVKKIKNSYLKSGGSHKTPKKNLSPLLSYEI